MLLTDSTIFWKTLLQDGLFNNHFAIDFFNLKKKETEMEKLISEISERWEYCQTMKRILKSLGTTQFFSLSLGDWISFTKRKLQKKFPENNLYSLYFKAYLNTVSTYFYTGRHISCPKKSPSHQLWLKIITGFWAPIHLI